ncbi:hypothetical protein EAG_08354, partial [Camponotus floridanus]
LYSFKFILIYINLY